MLALTQSHHMQYLTLASPRHMILTEMMTCDPVCLETSLNLRHYMAPGAGEVSLESAISIGTKATNELLSRSMCITWKSEAFANFNFEQLFIHTIRHYI